MTRRPPPVFLDRDGVINQNRDDYVRSLSQWVPIAGSLQAIARLSRAGHPVVVVSNQSAIARGLTTSDEVDRIHERMVAEVAELGGRIAGVYCCPHHPDEGCACRKPRTGLIERAASELSIDLRGGFMVGDAASDMAMARAAGLRAVLVQTGRGRLQLLLIRSSGGLEPDHVALDLSRAAEWILGC
ncbi:D-glycero-beta-D-manno-heptose 1,7-bisphosphate 7-phosphatase [Candidatus Fermentibacterales bacterium]|nr:D-glycero-beta-D-manno-heptose 1,7-bisphosphate 7-phosphatase [Candidatus Fermentibacterales bacterium]